VLSRADLMLNFLRALGGEELTWKWRWKSTGLRSGPYRSLKKGIWRTERASRRIESMKGGKASKGCSGGDDVATVAASSVAMRLHSPLCEAQDDV
jgi:hypothetical protein